MRRSGLARCDEHVEPRWNPGDIDVLPVEEPGVAVGIAHRRPLVDASRFRLEGGAIADVPRRAGHDPRTAERVPPAV